ncbi:Dabb family protein [Clostridium perfringens]|uniref:Stress-response A/B barrel domain-containing protein n=1 Tax=Clostridium perfringens TaxID=1502 RepID=A0AAW9J5M1_CLOPF|nr:Dabb family protein [Clostridium perfringens]MDZ5034700.1 hypothetical protein [Clostridium perfringens]
MIKHIVMWKLKDEAEGNSKAENAKIIKNSIEDLKEKINEIVDIEVGIDVNKSDQAYDVVLYSTFNSLEVVLCQYFGHKKSNFFMLHF